MKFGVFWPDVADGREEAHVVPVSDERTCLPHVLHSQCFCAPEVEPVGGATIIVHNVVH